MSTGADQHPPGWDEQSAASGAPSSSSRRASLFSKWRHRDRGGGGGGGGDSPPAPSHRPHYSSTQSSGNVGSSLSAPSSSAAVPTESSLRRTSLPGASAAIAAARAAELNAGLLKDDAVPSQSQRRSNGGGGGRTRSHRSRSRPRDWAARGGEGGAAASGEGGGEQPPGSAALSRSSSSRPRSGGRRRSKSRPKSRTRDRLERGDGERQQQKQQQQQQLKTEPSQRGIVRDESLRDYWKRRAEESKSRIGTASAGGASASGGGGGTPAVELNNSGSWGTKPTGMGGNPPPPPPRAGNRSRGRERAYRNNFGDDASVTSVSSSTPRKVDSIASALVGHARKASGGASSSSFGAGHARPQAASPARPGALSSLSQSNGARGSANSLGGKDADLSSLSPLHHALATANWSALHKLIQRKLSSDHSGTSSSGGPSDVAARLSVPHPREGGTALHVAAWKAPPALAMMMLRLMPRGSRETIVLLSIRDGEGNTPLHLCCGNLDWREDAKSGGDLGDGEKLTDHPLAVLREIAQSAPPGAWTVQNSEGDTPLHMLVSSPLCVADWRGLPTASPSNIKTARAKMALEAVRIALPRSTTSEGGGGNLNNAVDACMVKERTGATPLHVAVAAGAHDDVIGALLDAQPLAARAEDGRGMLPLHWSAAFGRVGHGAVRRLAEEHPRGLTCATVDGDIPLHLAVSNAMMEEEGGAAAAGAGRGGSAGGGGGGGDASSSSLRVDKNRLKIVELLMHDHRKASPTDGDTASAASSPILTTNREKLTPLHCCALFDAPPQISKLLMKHPDANAASSMTNSFGATPLHLAAAQPGVSQSIATVLAIGSPDAAAVQDRLKRTPLHVAAQNTYATNLLIKTLAELNPRAASVKTQRGHLPLHLAAQSQAKEAVVRALIKAHPAAAEARNKSNNTPLHDAAKYRASLGAVRLLLDAYPGALYVQNQYGNLPLHCATAYQAPSEVVQLLLKSWPEGASMQNRNQDAPLHYAAAYATSVHAVRPLIEAAPAAVLLMNSSGQSPVDRAKANNAPGDIVKLLENAAEEYQRSAASGDGSWVSFGQGSSGPGGGGGGTANASF